MRSEFKKSKESSLLAQEQCKWILLVLMILFLRVPINAQKETSSLSEFLDEYEIKTSVGLQLWSTYGFGMNVIDEDNLVTPADARFNTQLRRSRFSLTGKPYSTVSFKITAALDLVGHDVLSNTEAGGNNGSSPTFRIWNAFVQWQAKKKDDRLYLVGGYFVAPIGRESNVAALASTSFEKGWSQNYLRRHITGIGPGRAMGLLVAGQLHGTEGKQHLSYELALQNPLFTGLAGNSAGLTYSPLLSGRLAFQLGDPEQVSYRPGKKVNYFGKRKGVTLGVAAAHQGNTDLFDRNTAWGVDFLFNTASWQLDGEFFTLNRFGNAADGQSIQSGGQTGYVRISKNIKLQKGFFLEPVISHWFYWGGTSLMNIDIANQLGSFSGKDSGLDVGVNFYFNPKTKLSLFYASRYGDVGEGDPTIVNNNYFRQPGVGAIERGSYVGLGWVGIF